MASEKTKLSFSIGQVAQHTGLPQSVLRYWETVFDSLKPDKSPGGTRLYSQHDINLILRIKNLLYENGFTIKGANIQLKKEQGTFNAKQPEADFGSSATVAGSASKPVLLKEKTKMSPEEKDHSVSDLQMVVGRLKELIAFLDS